MKIMIQTIPHDQQRYETCGDWWFDASDNLHVSVSEMGNRDYEALIAVHEVVEALACRAHGVLERDVSAFDKGLLAGGYTGEPGDHPAAPYRREHCFATGIERLLAAELGVDWGPYSDAVEEL